MTVDTLYSFAMFLMKKNQAGGLGSVEFAYHWNASQDSYFSDLLGRFQMKNNGKEGNNTGLIQNEIIMTKLNPFTKNSSITIIGGQGIKPSDFAYTLGIRSNNAKVYQFDKDQMWSVLEDVIDPPSIVNDCYYYTEYQNYYYILPQATQNISLDYIANPIDIFWAYTFDVNGRQIWNPSDPLNSNPQWDDVSCREITERMLKTLGVSFQNQDFAQFGQSVINTGD